MYYQDLSAYTYTQEEQRTLNVGWLDKEHDYLKGEVDDRFLIRLRLFMEQIVHDDCFGPHRCELCNQARASGEIRVFGENGVIYASPTMIYHYVKSHHYLPPQEFIDAVLYGPLPGSTEYHAHAQACSWASQLNE